MFGHEAVKELCAIQDDIISEIGEEKIEVELASIPDELRKEVEDIRKKVMSTDVDITSKANKLLYACLKHPSRFMLGVAKLIISYYDKKTN